MTDTHLKYLRTEVIEDITAQRVREYEAKVGVTVALPVPLEQIVEQVLAWDKAPYGASAMACAADTQGNIARLR